mmetsp:Transcript_35108/g.72358  ORF Transcript_35108/g.72358 Transcript_35108/m.72358 type:complete len:116 (-) Transcript_35108:437-784(-)
MDLPSSTIASTFALLKEVRPLKLQIDPLQNKRRWTCALASAAECRGHQQTEGKDCQQCYSSWESSMRYTILFFPRFVMETRIIKASFVDFQGVNIFLQCCFFEIFTDKGDFFSNR